MMEIVKKIHFLGWKKKAVNRAQEVRRLNKKILELKESRDNWKNKASALQENNSKLEKELKKNF